MKIKSLSVFAMLLIPVLAFAADKNSAKVQIDEPVKISGTQLAPGQYRLTWEGNGPDVTVSFLEGKKTVATAPAKLVNASHDQPAIETVATPDNAQLLKAVDLSHLTIQFLAPVSASGN
jgi:phage tail sheath gpL-like